ncbi:MAG: pyridoxine 5'-phosphate synthase [Verrucomicrobiales bacterium]|nr:MAG: pyridoxine 5'-phosphate synthase [Verrucomicrobiaceae bacterium TMED76]RCL31131.1 MAG: pyridoxine 5'-phosphate synthase [Verrucomicrobiota bacterium]|tara:strand:- start:19 stop:765 length:747 start_codon:yes stop_codon:yes gene_type:complete
MGTLKLGVNIDHVATLRQARYKGFSHNVEPDLIQAANSAVKGGADSITVHLREDRRHIQDKDVYDIRKLIDKPLNLEMANVSSVLQEALKILPDYICLVPEKREELTTEGGLDVVANYNALKETTKIIQDKGILVSYFIDPDFEQIKLAADCKADMIELHTGKFANAIDPSEVECQLQRLIESSNKAHALDLIVNAGHGINTANVNLLFDVPHLNELNVGHHLISNSIISGIENSVKEFKKIMSQYNM